MKLKFDIFLLHVLASIFLRVVMICIIPVRLIYKEIWVPIMMIEHTIFAPSNTILSVKNACLLSYNSMQEGLVKILPDEDDPANKFCSIICAFSRSYDRWSAL